MAMRLAATSTEYVRLTAVSKAAGSAISMSAPPKFAFLPADGDDNPEAGDWLTGEWSTPMARILIGPAGGATTLTAGDYAVWITWTAGAETPVYRSPGTLTVY
ncbi:hypothetical protein [Streptomyces sp. NPDC008150]|uniref:hypothetical protein n=1 Tax=Streptomyces sp. NPDC008150 TaxID=3364816 RepID=UPI0036EC0E8E